METDGPAPKTQPDCALHLFVNSGHPTATCECMSRHAPACACALHRHTPHAYAHSPTRTPHTNTHVPAVLSDASHA